MANVSQIKLPNGTTYDIKDSISGYITDAGVTKVKGNAETTYRTGQVNLTASDVGAAASSHAHGNITSGGDITATAPTIASGDQIIINDNSASKITNGPTFDGSTTTTALTPKGTWETFSKFSGSYNDLTNKPTIPTKTSDLTNDSGFITSDNKVKQSPIGDSTLRKGVLLSYDSYSGLSNETTNTSYVSNRFLFCPGNSSGTIPSLEVLNSSGNKSARLSYDHVILQNSSNTYETTITAGTPTANRTLTLPNATGTIALTSDIPSVPDVSGKIDTAGTGLSKSGTTLNHSNSVTAQSTQAVYPIKIDAQGHISAYGSAVTIPSVTLNGSSTTSPSFYAPTGAGTSGQYLKSSGTGAPTWTNFPTIPTVPSAGTTATAVGTSSSGGSATTWSKSDHVHNITSSTITTALGYTPYNSTNPNGYTSNAGTVTGVKVNGTTINPTSGVVDIGTVATSDTQVTQTSIISNTSDNNLDHDYRLVLSGTATDTTETNTVYKVDTLRFNPYQARLVLAPSDTAVQPVLRITDTNNHMNQLSSGSNWFCVNDTSTSSATAGIRLSQANSSPYVEIFDGRSTATGNNTYRLFASGIAKVNNFGSTYKVQTNGTSSNLSAKAWTNKGSFTLAAGTYIINVTGIWGYTSNTGIRCVRLTTTNSTSNPAAVTDGAAATMSQHATYENKCGFSVILAPTASTTYYIMMYSTSSNTAFASYSYFRLL